MMKRNILFILICAMLVGTIACGNTQSEDTVAETLPPAETTLGETDREEIRDTVPESLDFTGQKLRVIYHDDERFKRDVVAVEMNGEVINDAVFKRNKEVEERLGITIEPVAGGAASSDVVNTVRTSVLAGGDDYDLACSHAIRTAGVVTEGIFYNLNDIKHLDFTQPWWNKNAIDQLTLGDKLYLAVGDYSTVTIGATYCMYFNKNLMEAYGTPPSDLYDTVLSGKWTYDELYKTVANLSGDLNGDSELTAVDQYGLVTTYNSPAVAYMWAFGNMLTKKGAGGYPELTIDQEKITAITEKVYNLYYGNDGTYVNTKDDNTIFMEGRAAFLNAYFLTSFNFRELNFDYGIIPYPKFDENQPGYRTMADGFHTLLCVPATCENPDMVGAALELLNAYSYKYVVPAYYETALKVKYTRDEESVQIMDLILDGLVFDFGYFYDNWKGFAFTIQDLMQKKSSDFASFYASRKSQAESYFAEVLGGFKNMN